MFGEKSRQIAALEQVNTQLTAQMTEAKPYLELAKQINAEVQASITSISEDSAALQLRLDEVISNLTTDLQVKTFMDLLADLPPEKKYTLLSNAFSNPIFDTALAIVQDKMQKKTENEVAKAALRQTMGELIEGGKKGHCDFDKIPHGERVQLDFYPKTVPLYSTNLQQGGLRQITGTALKGSRLHVREDLRCDKIYSSSRFFLAAKEAIIDPNTIIEVTSSHTDGETVWRESEVYFAGACDLRTKAGALSTFDYVLGQLTVGKTPLLKNPQYC